MSSVMDPRSGLQVLIENLEAARTPLQEMAAFYPVLAGASRALRRIAHIANRPLRIAILGESNSGKSTIANLIAGVAALPALPVANTRLPTLLHYAPVPCVEALHESGETLALGPDRVSLRNIVRLEVGLPSEMLRRVEILDFPGSANPLFRTDVLAVLRHRVDAAIWATVATQAWRETERLAWTGLPERIRWRGLLAVTHRDLLANEEDLRKLKGRLDAVAGMYFPAMCFVAAPGTAPADAADLFSEVARLTEQFETNRLEKALTITRQIAANALARLEEQDGLA